MGDNEMDFDEIKKLYHISENVGYTQRTISKAPAKIAKLPEVLTEYYSQLGKHSGLNHAHYDFYAPGQLAFLVYGEYLCFCRSKGEELFWYIDMEKLESENPPVFRRYVNGSVVHDELDSNTLEEFLYVIAYWQALFWLPYNSRGSVMCTFQQIERIQRKFQSKQHKLSKWPQFYGNKNDEVICICKEKCSAQILYACASKERFEEISTILF